MLNPNTFYNATVNNNVKEHGLTGAHNIAQQGCVICQKQAYQQGNIKLGNEYLHTMMLEESKRNNKK